MIKKVVGTLAAVVLLVGIGFAAFAKDDPAGGTSTLAPPRVERLGAEGGPRGRAGRPDRGEREFLLLHADGVARKRDGSTVQVRMQKGIIQAVDTHSITLKSPDGYVQTYKIDDTTKVFERRQESNAENLEAGNMAKVLAVKEGSGYTAKRINCVGKPGPRPAA